MMVGLPGSGKSTYAENLSDAYAEYLSTDALIEFVATMRGLSYNDVFKDSIKYAQEAVNINAALAFGNGADVIWDQTNLTVKSRASKLRMVPAGYKKIAVVVGCPDEEEHTRRLNSRPGKTIPPHIIKSMKATSTFPTLEEGFDDIIIVTT